MMHGMKAILLTFVALVNFSSASTLEVLEVFQPISLHETDVDYEFEGEHIQARIFSRPLVLSGAMPEGLVEAVASPHQIPAVNNYEVKECNLLALYKVNLSAELGERALLVTFDLKEMKAPEGVDLPIRTVLRLSIEALKKTLESYHHPENDPLKVRLKIAGTKKGNVSLKDLETVFKVGE